MPSSAPRPVPTMIDVGVARPMAHGQAMISTATAWTSAMPNAGSGPSQYQLAKVSNARTMITGTNHSVTRSTCAWMGSLLPCACSTIATIRASMLALPSAVACTRRAPF
jgi:hypothetical protein